MPMTLIRRPRSPKVLNAIVRDEVREAYRKLCVKAIETLQSDIGDWEHQPEFRYKLAVGEKLWYISIRYDSSSEAGEIYKYVDEGTAENAGKGEKYPIVPKNVKALAFAVPTPVKTSPGFDRVAGVKKPEPITGTRKLIYTQKVMHPGVRPREFTESLRKYLKNPKNEGSFKKVTDAAIKRGLRKLKHR